MQNALIWMHKCQVVFQLILDNDQPFQPVWVLQFARHFKNNKCSKPVAKQTLTEKLWQASHH